MVRLTIEMPEGALSALREAPERFSAEMRFAAAVQWYHQGRISGSKAAQVAGMTRLENVMSQDPGDWVYGQFAASGRSRASLLGLMECHHRFCGSPVGQAGLPSAFVDVYVGVR